jgi:mxaJ protein
MIAAALLALLSAAPHARAAHPARAPRLDVMRVCVDPNDLPFSARGQDGLDVRVATIVAADLGARLELVWVPLRRGLVRNTLGARRCDALMGVPARLERVLATRPYYRSSYVFASLAGRDAPYRSLDDPRLRTAKVGIELVGGEANPPAAHALARRGIVDNVAGFPVYGDTREPVPGGAIVRALQAGRLDVAIVWGPRAGYAARRDPRLVLTPVSPEQDGPLPFAFDVAIGVRRGNVALRDALDRALARRRSEIEVVLRAYGVPRVPAPVQASTEARR